MRAGIVGSVVAALVALALMSSGVAGPTAPSVDHEPHVIVGIPDTGINPYHEVFHRPGLTEHPCTWIQDFPCSVETLPLSVGESDWETAFEADRNLWENLEPGTWYWIPETVFVAVGCEDPERFSGSGSDYCFLDDANMHGTGTASSVVMENPDASIAFKAGGSSILPFQEAGLPVDVYSVSWGNRVPFPTPPGVICPNHQTSPVFVTSAGNDPRSTIVDCRKADPRVISVGGAYAEDDTEEALAAKHPEVVSYYCRPTAQTQTVDEYRASYCGTSFSAPTVAGALSKVILGLREASGYTGSITGGYVDPVLGVTVDDLRDAMNRTASYDPEPRYDNQRITGVPLNGDAPWYQWGWGFYDGDIADVTLAHLLGEEEAPEKPEGARDHMARTHAARRGSHDPFPDWSAPCWAARDAAKETPVARNVDAFCNWVFNGQWQILP